MKRIVKNVKFRRRRSAVTDYKKRLSLVKGSIDRIVVRKTNKRILGQIVRYTEKGDMTSASVDSNELSKFKWSPRSNRATAYLTGLLLAKKVGKDEQQKEHILDIGLSSPVKNSIPFVFAKGCADGGMKLRGTFQIDENVYNYSNSKYASELKQKDSQRYQRQYGKYLKQGSSPELLGKAFAEAKGMILNQK